ncbi:hypothetical protein CBS101457_002577 [Exobasidium rhododendri]|nr:hypothetical protein CBS101457_002577 [Exobasidium rhododendri]
MVEEIKIRGGAEQMQTEAVASSSSSLSYSQSRARISPSDGKDDRRDGPKRPRRVDADLASRGKRMFGLLNSTLSKAKEDNAKRSTGEAARKRAEIESRLQEKLKAEDETIKHSAELADELKSQLTQAYSVAMDIYSHDAMVRIRKSHKRRLASFMITPSKYSRLDGESAEKMSLDGKVIATDVASCLAPLHMRTAPDPPVYFLPKRMLEKQDDTLDDQEDRVDDAIEKADIEWEKQKTSLQEDLDRIKANIKRIRKELAQAEQGQKSLKEGSPQKEDD